MTRLHAFAAALAAALYLLNDTGTIRLSGDNSDTGAISGHTGASSPRLAASRAAG